MGLQTVYGLLAAFPASGSVVASEVWIAGIGAELASGLMGMAMAREKPEPMQEVIETPKDPARAA
jgi:hypothetical protein